MISYCDFVQFTKDFIWIFTGLSAGFFAAFFSWWSNKLKDKRQLKSVSALILTELFKNYIVTTRAIYLFKNSLPIEPFAKYDSWDKTKCQLAQNLDQTRVKNIEFCYINLFEFENLVCSKNRYNSKNVLEKGILLIDMIRDNFYYFKKITALSVNLPPESEVLNDLQSQVCSTNSVYK